MNTANSNIPKTFSQGQTESDFFGAYLDEVNGLQNENDFFRALLRKHKIQIPDGPYGQKQHG